MHELRTWVKAFYFTDKFRGLPVNSKKCEIWIHREIPTIQCISTHQAKLTTCIESIYTAYQDAKLFVGEVHLAKLLMYIFRNWSHFVWTAAWVPARGWFQFHNVQSYYMHKSRVGWMANIRYKLAQTMYTAWLIPNLQIPLHLRSSPAADVTSLCKHILEIFMQSCTLTW